MKLLKGNKNILNEINKKSYIKRVITFIVGILLMALSYNIFLATNNLVPGGVTGLAIIITNFIPIDNSLVILFFNLILLVISYFALGKEKTKATILGALLLPLFISITKNVTDLFYIDTSQLLLSSVIGGVLFGFGAGLVFKTGFSTGGTDIINLINAKYFKISIGTSMLITDGLIVLLSSFAFGMTRLMYSIVILYIMSLMSDRVILGVSDSKAFYIITDKDDEIKEFILKNLNHGVTIFKAKGGFKKENRNVLMCVLPTKEYYQLRTGISEIDKDAFFVVTDAYEVFGGE